MINVVVRKTNKKGKGIFAAKNFKKGQIVLKMNTKNTINLSQVKKLSKDDKGHLGYTGNGRYFVMKSPERFLNHSCDPNVYDRIGILRAIRNIRKGEEICIDYSVSGFNKWKMKCHCGSKNCRKIIHGEFKKLPVNLQEKYSKYLEKWYKKEFMVRK